MTVVYEDNHIIVVNKTASEIVQGDKTGDMPLSETVKQYLKEKYNKRKCVSGSDAPSGPSGERTGGLCKDQQGVVAPERYVPQR